MRLLTVLALAVVAGLLVCMGCLMASCGGSERGSPEVAEAREPSPRPVAASPSLVCRPAILRPGEVLRLEMGAPHGGELSIITPGGDYFLVAYRRLSSDALDPRISPERFRSLATFELPAGFEAYHYRAGVTDYEPVFREPGTYEVITGDALRSDMATSVARCGLQYSPEER